MLQALHCRFLAKPTLWGWSNQRKWEGGWGLVLTLYSPGGRARARGSMPQGGEQRCQEMLISQD